MGLTFNDSLSAGPADRLPQAHPRSSHSVPLPFPPATWEDSDRLPQAQPRSSRLSGEQPA